MLGLRNLNWAHDGDRPAGTSSSATTTRNKKENNDNQRRCGRLVYCMRGDLSLKIGSLVSGPLSQARGPSLGKPTSTDINTAGATCILMTQKKVRWSDNRATTPRDWFGGRTGVGFVYGRGEKEGEIEYWYWVCSGQARSAGERLIKHEGPVEEDGGCAFRVCVQNTWRRLGFGALYAVVTHTQRHPHLIIK